MRTINVEKRELSGAAALVDVTQRAPAACISLLFRVGSLYEDERVSGISHFLEHLFYRGSKKRPKIRISEEILGTGGINSAGTWYDWTQFWTAVPLEYFDLALDGLFDCAFGMLLDEKEIEEERRVVLEEILRHGDERELVLFEKMLGELFGGHPVKRPIMGTAESVSRITARDIREFHGKYYTPGNLVATVSGDVEAGEVFSKLEKYIPRAAKSAPSKTPAFAKKKNVYSECVSIEKTARCQLYIGARIPAYSHIDAAATTVLAEILGGGESSILHRRAVEEEKAASVMSAGLVQMKDAGVLYFSGVPLEYGGLYKLRNLIFRELSEFLESGPRADELETAKRKCALKFLAQMERAEGRAYALSASEAYGGWEIRADFPEKISELTAEDVRSAAAEYLKSGNLAGAFLMPEEYEGALEKDLRKRKNEFETLLSSLENPGGGAGKNRNTQFAPVKPHGKSAARIFNSTKGAVSPEREFILSNGIRGVYRRVKGLPLAAIGVYARAGQAFETENLPGLAYLTAECMASGTAGKTKTEIQKAAGLLGGELSLGVFRDYTRFGFLVESGALSEAAELLGEILASPSFDPGEMEKTKHIIQAGLMERGENIITAAFDEARASVYGGLPYRRPIAGTADSLGRISRKHIADFHAKKYCAGNLLLCVCGEMSARGITAMLEKSFGRVRGGRETAEYPAAVAAGVPGKREVSMGKKQALVILAFSAPPVGSGEFAALEAARSILGYRIYREVIYGKSLAYDAGVVFETFKLGGMFAVYAAASPEKIRECFRMIRGIAEEFRESGPDEGETGRAKNGFIGAGVLDSQSLENLMREGTVWRIISEAGLKREALKKEFGRLDAQTVRAAMRKCVKPENETVVAVNFGEEL